MPRVWVVLWLSQPQAKPEPEPLVRSPSLDASTAPSVESEWRREKALKGAIASPAMDELMGLTGLTRVKREVLGLYRKVMIDKEREPGARSDRALNFLFTGNPGTGKTTGRYPNFCQAYRAAM